MPGTMSLINRNELLERCMQDAEFAGQMLDIFIDSSVKTVESLKVSLDAKVTLDAKRHAHTLKGSAGNLAMESLRVLAAQAEKLAAEGNLTAVSQQLPQIEQVLAACLEEASSLKQQLAQAA